VREVTSDKKERQMAMPSRRATDLPERPIAAVVAGMQERLDRLPPRLSYLRVFLSGASQETPDKQGRVTVPQPLRDYAGLTKDCVVIGAGSRLEVWDAQAWETYLAANETTFAEQSEEVLPGLI